MNWIGNIAVSLDNFMGKPNEQTNISNFTDWKCVHVMRHNSVAIVVGSNTVLTDDPSLKIKRKYLGMEPKKIPVRIIFDRRGRIDKNYKVMQDTEIYPTFWITNSEETIKNVKKVKFHNLKDTINEINRLLKPYTNERATVMVEGGPRLLSVLINNQILSKLRVFRNSLLLKEGNDIFEKITSNLELIHAEQILNGTEEIYRII